MDELQQEQFTKALLGLVDLAKTKKNVLQYGEINDAFKGLELTEDKMDLVLEYLEKQKIDIVNAEVGVDNAEDMIWSASSLLFACFSCSSTASAILCTLKACAYMMGLVFLK